MMFYSSLSANVVAHGWRANASAGNNLIRTSRFRCATSARQVRGPGFRSKVVRVAIDTRSDLPRHADFHRLLRLRPGLHRQLHRQLHFLEEVQHMLCAIGHPYRKQVMIGVLEGTASLVISFVSSCAFLLPNGLRSTLIRM